MKYKILFILSIIGIIIISGCTQNTVPSKTVKLNLTMDEWVKENHKITSFIIEAKEGEEFGPINFTASSKNKPFKLLKIIDENNIKVQFDDSLVVVGEPITEPSKQNPKIVSVKETCFRTRSYDSGTDLCLKIIK